jgi:hypothetical protein
MTDTPPVTTRPTPSPAPKPRPPLRVFFPLIGVIVILVLYTAYWFFAAGKLHEEIKNFAAQSDSRDIVIGWNHLSRSGYPYRIAITFDQPSVRAPHTPEGWAWTASDIEADFLPYNLRHVVLKVDGEQRLHYNDLQGRPRRHLIRARAEGTWASYSDIKDEPFGHLAIDISKLVAVQDGDAKGSLDSDNTGERLTAGRLQLHMRPSTNEDAPLTVAPTTPDTSSYDIALQGDDMTVTDATPTAAVLGHNIKLIMVQARLRDLPKSSSASLVKLSRNWLQKGGRLTVSDLRIIWGPLDLRAQGEITLDDQARPKGQFNAEFTNYAELLDALVKAHVIRAKDAKLANAGLNLVAQLQGRADGQVSVPITLNNGKLFFGPLVIATLDPVY